MSPTAYSFLGLTAIVAGLVGILVFAMLRFAAAARDTRRQLGASGGGDGVLLTAALHDAVAKLKAQERATAARAEASERLSGEIISSLTAGLLVVGLDGEIRILNPAGRRMLDVPESMPAEEIERAGRRPGGAARGGGLREQPLRDVIDECLRRRSPIV